MQANYSDNNIPGMDLNDIAASFQKSAVSALLQKVDWALEEYNVKSISLVGGVAANLYLRENLKNLADKFSMRVIIPDLQYCGDNGAMIANRASMLAGVGSSSLSDNAYASLPQDVFKEASGISEI